jgi:hypothetical protein
VIAQVKAVPESFVACLASSQLIKMLRVRKGVFT